MTVAGGGYVDVKLAPQRDERGEPTQILGIAGRHGTQARNDMVRHHERLLQLLAYDIHDGLVQDVVGCK